MDTPIKKTIARNVLHYTILSGILAASYPFQLYFRYNKEPLHPIGVVCYSLWFLLLIYCLLGLGASAGIYALCLKEEEK